MFDFLWSQHHETQKERLLDLFLSKKGETVTLPEILALRPRIAHYTQAVMTLREEGHDIMCRSWYTSRWGKKIHCSEYTYLGKTGVYRKHPKKTFTQADMDKEYERGVQNTLAQL